MRHRSHKLALAAGLALAVAMPAGAPALAASGGAEAEPAPRVSGVQCIRSCTKGLPRGGSLVLIRGRGLSAVSRAIFSGGEGGVRSVGGRASASSASGVRVRVPWEAVSGRFVLRTRYGASTRPARITIAAIPVVASTRCIRSCAPGRVARAGSLVLVRGVRLSKVASAVLNGRRGSADDRRARVGSVTFESFRMRIPAGARSGAFTARERGGKRSPERRIVLGSSAPVPGAGIFPVRGPHNFGSSGARFGAGRGGRSHRGQDVMARCGVPMVSAVAGRVQYSGYQSAAGNYVVIDGSRPDVDYVYMHLRSRSVKVGQRVAAGQSIGQVGETGNAQGCHLHFEMWSAPGWYEGGHAFDPLPQLRAWDRTS